MHTIPFIIYHLRLLQTWVTYICTMTSTSCLEMKHYAFAHHHWWGKTDLHRLHIHCTTSLLVRQQVKFMHSTSQSQRLHLQHLWALVWPAAMSRRLESLLSHFEECLWLSLEGSSQGWREAERGRDEDEGVKKLEKGGRGDLYSSLICDTTAKVGRQKIRVSGGMWRDYENGLEIRNETLHDWLLFSLRLPGNKICSWCQMKSEGILKKGQQTFLECLIFDRLLKYFF